MNQGSLRALLVLNAVLLAAVAVIGFSPNQQEAYAQFGARADYLMIAGSATGRPQQEVVYIIELNSARIASVIFNSDNDTLTVFGARDAAKDLQKVRDRR